MPLFVSLSGVTMFIIFSYYLIAERKSWGEFETLRKSGCGEITFVKQY